MELKEQDFQNLRNAKFNEIVNLSNGKQVLKTSNCFDEPDCTVCCFHNMCDDICIDLSKYMPCNQEANTIFANIDHQDEEKHEPTTNKTKKTRRCKRHRENCDSTVRKKTIINFMGNKITLIGKHALEWSVVIEENDTTRMFTFRNREEATKEFERLTK